MAIGKGLKLKKDDDLAILKKILPLHRNVFR
jgi:hypothetical protein